MRRVHRGGLDGTGEGNEAWRTAQWRKWTSYVRNGVLLIGTGLAYCKTEETELCSSSYGRNEVLLIGRGVAYRKTDETDLLRSKRGSCSSGGVWRTAKRDSTGYCSSPPSTFSSLHGLPSTSSSLHGLLFIQPPPRATPPATVQPPLHGHPFTVYYSSNPPRGRPVHPEATPWGPVHPPQSLTVHPTPPPPQCSLFIQRQHRSASVSSRSGGIARSGSVNCHRSLARVQ